MDCRLGGEVISDRASFSDALAHSTDATLPHIVFTLASECHGACEHVYYGIVLGQHPQQWTHVHVLLLLVLLLL